MVCTRPVDIPLVSTEVQSCSQSPHSDIFLTFCLLFFAMVAIARIVKEERRRIKSRVRRFPPSEDLDYATEDAARRRKVSTTSSFKPPNINPNSIRTLNRPGSHTLRPVVSEATQKGLNLRALSVHYLKTGFLNEVRRAGFTSNSTVYVIENLKGPKGWYEEKDKI